MNKSHPVVMLLACMFIIESTTAQDSANRVDQFISSPSRFLEYVNDKASRLENNIVKRTDKALKQLSKEERRLKKKLNRKDPVMAKQLFDNAPKQYNSLQLKITDKINKIKSKEYIPYLDTLTTSLHFLQKNTAIANSVSVQQTLQSIHEMEDRFQQVKEIQQYLQNRRKFLREQLNKLNMVKALKQYHKKLYYYQAQIEEYRNIIKQPDRIERKAIELLSKTKLFQEFLAKNSIVAALFGGSRPTPTGVEGVALPGLQTSMQVNEIIQQTTGGPNNLQGLQANIKNAQDQLQQLKNKFNTTEQNDGDADIPNFRPNNQRVKSFWERWELGANLQSSRSSNWLPAATQIGLSAGYKLNDRSIVGIGMSGSVGWGKSIKHIIVSYEGVGVRSFFDWKLKGSFWLSAGYEMNYQYAFNRVEQLKSLGAWQQSGLIGVSKKYRISKKMKGSMNLLWDCLSYSQIPRSQPLRFRVGYIF